MEAATRPADRIGTETGDHFMTRHGMIQPPVEGAQPLVKNPRVSMVIIDADRATSGHAPHLQHPAAEWRSGPAASIPALPEGGRTIADISRKRKSP